MREAHVETSTESESTEHVPDHPENETAGSVEGSSGPVVAELDRRGLTYEVLGEHAVRVVIPTGDVVMGAVPLLTETNSVAILAEGRDGASAILLRDGADMCVVRRNPGVWEHFRSPGGPSAVIGSWRSGERTRFRQRHGALWQALPLALELAERFGIADLMPEETPPPPPPTLHAASHRTSAPKAKAAPKKKAGSKAAAEPPVKQGEPIPPICPDCFTMLPSTGRCDCRRRL